MYLIYHLMYTVPTELSRLSRLVAGTIVTNGPQLTSTSSRF